MFVQYDNENIWIKIFVDVKVDLDLVRNCMIIVVSIMYIFLLNLVKS